MQYMHRERHLFGRHTLLRGGIMNKRSFLKWLKGTIIRAIKSIAQTAIASIGTASVVLSEFNWGFVLMTSGMAGIISLLMSFEKIPEDDTALSAGTEQKASQTTAQSAEPTADRAADITKE